MTPCHVEDCLHVCMTINMYVYISTFITTLRYQYDCCCCDVVSRCCLRRAHCTCAWLMMVMPLLFSPSLLSSLYLIDMIVLVVMVMVMVMVMVRGGSRATISLIHVHTRAPLLFSPILTSSTSYLCLICLFKIITYTLSECSEM